MEKIEFLINKIEDLGHGKIAVHVKKELLEDLEQLKSSLPKPVEVPEFVARWYEERRYDTLETKFRRAQVDKDERVRKWYDNCQGRHANKRANAQEVIAKMELSGYTAVKEPLYEVRLPFEQWDEDSAEVETEFAILAYDITSGETKFVSSGTKFFSNNHVTKISEERIKLIDERYWAFAVPVEEE